MIYLFHKRPFPKSVNLFLLPNIHEKLNILDAFASQSFEQPKKECIPQNRPAREVEVLNARLHPPKLSISTREGQARLLHDLANIELQATELALRTLNDFPDAPKLFREELTDIAVNEGSHLRKCLEGLDAMGFSWGHWPVHTALWEATSSSDSLMDRIVIVHRYLEGAGLDASDSILKKLSGVDSKIVRGIIEVIRDEEIGHVEFGSRWYHQICKLEGLNPEDDFKERLFRLRRVLPIRREPISHTLRKKAGFLDAEILIAASVQNWPKAV